MWPVSRKLTIACKLDKSLSISPGNLEGVTPLRLKNVLIIV